MASRKKQKNSPFVKYGLMVLLLVGLTAALFLSQRQVDDRSRAAAPSNAIRYADFETGNFTQLQNGNPTLQAVNVFPSASSVTIAEDKAYEGSRSARTSIPVGDGNKYARTIWELTTQWTEGTDIWYGQAVYFPVGFKNAVQSYFVPMRWDDYGSNAYTTYGGISMWSDKRFRLFRVQYGVSPTEEILLGPFDIPEGSWQWLEVHQKFSKTDGQAINEVYLNDMLMGSSIKANFYGDPITRLRNGIVALGTQTNALEFWTDRLTIATARVGSYLPSVNPTMPPTATPTPTITLAPTIPPVTDITSPAITISSPVNGIKIGRSVNISATATDNVKVFKLEVFINGELKTSNSNSNTITYNWNTKKTPLGAHTIVVKAFDAAGNVGQSSVTVYK